VKKLYLQFEIKIYVNFILDVNYLEKQYIIKQLLNSVFVISEIIKVEVSVISRRLRLITLTETLIISDITKTEFNNCLQYGIGNV
jgi:hypothetical protein